MRVSFGLQTQVGSKYTSPMRDAAGEGYFMNGGFKFNVSAARYRLPLTGGSGYGAQARGLGAK